MFAFQLRYSLRSGGVASGFRFGEAPGAKFLSLGERNNKFPALFFVTEAIDVTST